MARLKTTGRPSFRPKINNGRFQKKKFKPVPKELYGDNWEELSDYVRKRDNYTCQGQKLGLKRCGSYLPPPFSWLLHCHHIVPLPKGSNHPSNLISLCRECHGLIHNKSLGTITDKQKRAARKFR